MSDTVAEQDTGLLKDKTFQAIYNAFQLGWSLYELKSRVLLASLLPEAAGENGWLRSVWRALFNQIADLHSRCSLEDASDNDGDNSKLYGYPSTIEAKQNYPYLYFIDNSIEYPKLGMPTTVDVNKFGLPDLVYRALNCLILLYTDPEATLSPETVIRYQQDLLTSMETSPPSVDEPGARKLLSGFIVKLLVIWDNYVREHLYNGGMIKNDEIELVAYEAGRSMSSLPWGISVRTVVMEGMLLNKSDSTPDEQSMEKLYSAWQDVFDNRNIVHIQHQISALGQVMDNAYYNVIPGTHRPGAEQNKDTNVDDAHLPTRSIRAIYISLDYWLRAIQWLGKEEVQKAIRTRDNYTGTQSILTGELTHDLRIALIQQSDVWHSLMTYELNLGNFGAEFVTLNILNDFMVKLEQAIKKRSSADLPILIVIGVFALVFLLLAGIFVYTQSSGTQPAIIAFIVAALAAGGRAVMSWVTRLRGIFGASGQAISDALQKGYQQLLVEFGDLNYNVAISIALASFFIKDVDWLWKAPSDLQIVVNDAYSFLTEIVWTGQERAEEIDRVAVAAFGPLGALVGEQLDSSGQAGGKKKP